MPPRRLTAVTNSLRRLAFDMGVRVSTIPQDPSNRFLPRDSADKPKVRFDLTGEPTVISSFTAHRNRIPMVKPQHHEIWFGRSSTWRRACGSVLTLFGVATLICALVLHDGTFSFPIPTMDTILVSARHLLPTPTRLFRPSRPSRDLLLPAITDSLLARALPLGRHDYALSTNGGKLFLPLTTQDDSIESSAPIDSILSDDFRIKGPWRFPDSHAQVGLSFPLTIYPTHFTIDYALNPDLVATKSAPRQLIIWGVVEGTGNKARYARTLTNIEISDVGNRTAPPLHRGEIFIPLGSAEYDVHGGPHVQTFPLHPGVVESGIDFGVVVVEVISNWGGDETWLFRVCIHGSASVKH